MFYCIKRNAFAAQWEGGITCYVPIRITICRDGGIVLGRDRSFYFHFFFSHSLSEDKLCFYVNPVYPIGLQYSIWIRTQNTQKHRQSYELHTKNTIWNMSFFLIINWMSIGKRDGGRHNIWITTHKLLLIYAEYKIITGSVDRSSEFETTLKGRNASEPKFCERSYHLI